MALAPLPMTSTAPSAPSGGSDLLSNSTTSIGWPSTPPAALISSTASLAPAIVSASIGWNQPLKDMTSPNTGFSAAAARKRQDEHAHDSEHTPMQLDSSIPLHPCSMLHPVTAARNFKLVVILPAVSLRTARISRSASPDTRPAAPAATDDEVDAGGGDERARIGHQRLRIGRLLQEVRASPRRRRARCP